MTIREIEDYVLLKTEDDIEVEIKKYLDLGFEPYHEGFKTGDLYLQAMIKYKA